MRQARRILSSLIYEKWLRVISNHYGGKPGSTRRYQIALDRLATEVMQDLPTGVTDDTWVTDDTGVTQDRDGGHARPETGGLHDPLTIIEPSRTTNKYTRTRATQSLESKPASKNKNANHRSPSAKTGVCPDDVPQDVWQDFQALRKAKRAPLTSTALDGIARQAAKANMTMADALRMCCERGWAGFKADWVANGQRGADASSRHTGFDQRNYEVTPDGRIPD